MSRTMDKRFVAVLLAGLLAVSSHTQAQDLRVSPDSGVLLDSSQFDLALVLDRPWVSGGDILSINYTLNGMPVDEWFKGCMNEGTTADGRVYFLCKNQSGAALGIGNKDLHIRVRLKSGELLQKSVHYEVLDTRIPSITQVSLAASRQQFNTGIEIKPWLRYEISATGTAMLWPTNPNFAIATPRGNGTTCGGCPVSGGPTGALIAKIGQGPWFLVSDRRVIDANSPPSMGHGPLFLSVNDHTLHDNLGTFEVTVKELP